jgi:acetolactate synthase-1/2/3 large subunit
MAPSDILISDVGAHKLWLGRLFPAYEPNTVIISNGFATMGIGLPGAIAAALAQPERRAVTVSGDGGFLMNLQEMETATRLGLPVVVVVWVDGAYGVIGWKQERRFGRTHAIEFGNPGWAELAAAFGWSHRHATDGEALRGALEAALAEGGPALVTVPIDYRQNARLASLGEPALGA